MSTRKERLRPLFVTTQLGNGGAEAHLVRLVGGFDPAQVKPAIGVLRGSGSYEADLPDTVQVHELCPRWSPRSTTARLGISVAGLTRLIDVWKPDVVCGVMDIMAPTVAAARRLSNHRPPAVLNVQLPPTQGWTKDGRISHPLGALVRQAYRHFDRIVALSEGVANDTNKFARHGVPIVTIPNAVIDGSSMDRIEEVLPRPRPPGQLLVACGRLVPQKAFDVLLDAMALLKQRDLHPKLWILGTGPLQSDLETQARRLGVESQVEFLGFQHNPHMYFRVADAFVLSSRFEGLGMVIIEAMAAGAPVVSSNCPHGPDEIISHENNGLLVQNESASSLADGLERVLKNRALRERLAEGGRQRAVDYSAPVVAKRFTEALGRLAYKPAQAAVPS